jgi:hypothetical protein
LGLVGADTGACNSRCTAWTNLSPQTRKKFQKPYPSKHQASITSDRRAGLPRTSSWAVAVLAFSLLAALLVPESVAQASEQSSRALSVATPVGTSRSPTATSPPNLAPAKLAQGSGPPGTDTNRSRIPDATRLAAQNLTVRILAPPSGSYPTGYNLTYSVLGGSNVSVCARFYLDKATVPECGLSTGQNESVRVCCNSPDDVQGIYTVNLTATAAGGERESASTGFLAGSDNLSVYNLGPRPPLVTDVGLATTIYAPPSLGPSVPETTSWAGLPAGCSKPVESAIGCNILTIGNYSITTNTTLDSNLSIYTHGVLVVNPTLVASIIGNTSVTPGVDTNLSARVEGGTMPYASFAWLVGGQVWGKGSSLQFGSHTLGAYVVTLRVTDIAGETSETNLTVSVVLPSSPPPVTQASPAHAWFTIADGMVVTVVIAGVAALVGYAVFRRRRSPPIAPMAYRSRR